MEIPPRFGTDVVDQSGSEGHISWVNRLRERLPSVGLNTGTSSSFGIYLCNGAKKVLNAGLETNELA
jgi:hypothetical protein